VRLPAGHGALSRPGGPALLPVAAPQLPAGALECQSLRGAWGEQPLDTDWESQWRLMQMESYASS